MQSPKSLSNREIRAKSEESHVHHQQRLKVRSEAMQVLPILGTCFQSEFPSDWLILSVQRFFSILPMQVHRFSSCSLSSAWLWEKD